MFSGLFGGNSGKPMPQDEERGPVPNLSTVRLFTVGEVAELFRVSNMTVYRLVRDRKLRAVRVGHSYRIPAQAVFEYLYKSGRPP